MFTLYPDLPDRKKNNRSNEAAGLPWFSPANRRSLLTIIMTLAFVAFSWDVGFCSNVAKTKSVKNTVRQKSLRSGTSRDKDAFSSVLSHLKTYRQTVKNTRYLTIIDYSKPSNVKRMYLMDMKTGKVEKFFVSHGKNSGWAYATAFSNRPESFQSSRGFFITGRKYTGKHGTALELYGLEKGVNDNALRRGLVMHGADYVSARSVLLNGGRLGRSLGCPAIPIQVAESVINRIKGGSLVYIHAGGKYCAAKGSNRAPAHGS